MAESEARTVASGLRWSEIKVFKFRLNDASDGESRMYNGIKFHTAGAPTLKARLPIEVLVRG